MFTITIQLLHIPDGFLSLIISIVCWILTGIVLFVAIRKAQKSFDERLVQRGANNYALNL